jgi:uncharacterized protein (UPF0147 family)
MVKIAIRRRAQEFFSSNSVPTIKILAAVNDNSDIPVFKRVILYEVISSLNLKFCKIKRNSYLQ